MIDIHDTYYGNVEPEMITIYDKLISSDSAFIDTNIIYDTNHIIDTTFCNIGNISWRVFAGVSSGYYNRSYFSISSTDAKNIQVGINTAGDKVVKVYDSTAFKSQYEHRLVVDITNMTAKFDGGELTDITPPTTSGGAPVNMSWRLFGASGYGASEITSFMFRNFIVKSQGGEMLYNLLPAMLGSESGMYDMVNKVFYRNAAGQGTLTAIND